MPWPFPNRHEMHAMIPHPANSSPVPVPKTQGARWHLPLAAVLLCPFSGCSGGGGGGEPADPALRIVQLDPADASTLPASPPRVTVAFNEPLDSAAVAGDWLSVAANGSALAGAVALNSADGKQLLFTPTASFPQNTPILCTVSPSVTAQTGRMLGTARSFTFSVSVSSGSLTNLISLSLPTTQAEFVGMATMDDGKVALGLLDDITLTTMATFYDPSTKSWSALEGIGNTFPGQYGFRMGSDGTNGLIMTSLRGDFLCPQNAPATWVADNRILQFNDKSLFQSPGASAAPASPFEVWNAGYSIPHTHPSEQWDPVQRRWLQPPAAYSYFPRPVDLVGVLPYSSTMCQLVVASGQESCGSGTGQITLSYQTQDLNGVRGPLNNLATYPCGTKFHHVAANEDKAGMVVVAKQAAVAVELEVWDYTFAGGWSGPVRAGNLPYANSNFVAMQARLMDGSGAAAVVGFFGGYPTTCASRPSRTGAWSASYPVTSSVAPTWCLTEDGSVVLYRIGSPTVDSRRGTPGAPWVSFQLPTNVLPAGSIAFEHVMHPLDVDTVLWSFQLDGPSGRLWKSVEFHL